MSSPVRSAGRVHGTLRFLATLILYSATLLTAQGGSIPGGIGGTGFVPGGIGGTGFVPGGIGGTGIIAIGPVQRFGSVFVLGKEYHFTPQTLFSSDGAPSTEKQLQLGDAVSVSGLWQNGRWVARQVQTNNALIGRIEQVDARQNRLRVLGQTVLIAPNTALYLGQHTAIATIRDLHPGDMVRVSAPGRSERGWVASTVTRVRTVGQTPSLFLRGTIQALDTQRRAVKIHNVWLPLPKPLSNQFKPGQQVLAYGHYVADQPRLARLKLDVNPALIVGESIELYGLIRKTPDGVYCNEFRLEGNTALPQEAITHSSAAWGLIEGRISAPGIITTNNISLHVDPMEFGLNLTHPVPPPRSIQPSEPAENTTPAVPHELSAPEQPSSSSEVPESIKPPSVMVPSVEVGHPEPSDVPELSIPTVPSVPSTPSIPSVPSTPSIPSVPSTPSIPSVPSIPALPAAPPEIPKPPESPY